MAAIILTASRPVSVAPRPVGRPSILDDATEDSSENVASSVLLSQPVSGSLLGEAVVVATRMGTEPIINYAEPPNRALVPPLYKELSPHAKALEDLRDAMFYYPPPPSSTPNSQSLSPHASGDFCINFAERKEISPYTDICLRSHYIFSPIPETSKDTAAGRFYSFVKTLLLKETMRLDPKYTGFIETLEKTVADALTLASNTEMIKELFLKECDQHGKRLACVLKGREGLYADLALCEGLIQQCSAPGFLCNSRKQKADVDCDKVVYPNIFEPKKPITIAKSNVNWENECRIVENVYGGYIELLDLHIIHLNQMVKQYHRLGEILANMKVS